jgi:methylthioribose-1-phosphate isomerase
MTPYASIEWQDGVQVANPAFDVTPAEYITGFITEAGIALPPFSKSLPRVVEKGQELRQSLRNNT